MQQKPGRPGEPYPGMSISGRVDDLQGRFQQAIGMLLERQLDRHLLWGFQVLRKYIVHSTPGSYSSRKIESRTGQYQPDAHHFHVPPWQNATNGLGLGESRCLLLFPIIFAFSENERTEPSIAGLVKIIHIVTTQICILLPQPLKISVSNSLFRYILSVCGCLTYT
jgi:hypothetical protein